MSGRNRCHVKDFAVGGVAAVEIVAVPGGHALRRVIGVFLRDIDTASHRIRLADAINAAALWDRLARLNGARACGNAVTWIDLAGHLAARAVGEQKAGEAESGKPRGLGKTNIVE